MKFRVLLFVIVSVVSCHKNNYELIYNQEQLTISDCKNITLANWILLHEAGLAIDQKIQVITTDYNGGIPLQIEEFPVYYKAHINEEQYTEYKQRLLTGKHSDSWRFYEKNEQLHFVRDNKFELACKIKKDMILFGFRNVEGVAP